MGKTLIISGIILIVLGLIYTYWDSIPYLGKLPGDIEMNRKHFKFYFPIATSILLGIAVSIILYLISKLR